MKGENSNIRDKISKPLMIEFELKLATMVVVMIILHSYDSIEGRNSEGGGYDIVGNNDELYI